MKKKFLALVLTLAMVLSLAPVGALATNGEESQTPEDVIYDNTAYRGNATVDGVDSLDKTAKKTGENTYEVKLEVKMHETTSTISQAAATVLVIDVSDSMNDRTCGKKEHTHTNDCYTTEKNAHKLRILITGFPASLVYIIIKMALLVHISFLMVISMK